MAKWHIQFLWSRVQGIRRAHPLDGSGDVEGTDGFHKVQSASVMEDLEYQVASAEGML